MLDTQTKRRIDDCRDILVGKLPDPKAQIEQITIGLIYKFMDDMDKEAVELGGKAKFFSDYNIPDPEFPNDRNKDKTIEFSKYAWDKLMHPKVTAAEMLALYSEAIEGMEKNPNIPPLFRDIFNNAYLPYRDPETLKLFLKTIGEFEYTHSEKLGDAFEYLLSVMGSQGDAGQFRTPRHIIDFLVAIIDPDKTDTILDPACGTAGFLISAYKHILLKYSKGNKKRLNVYQYNQLPDDQKFPLTFDQLTPDDRKKLIQNFVGYDISPDMVRLSLVNLYLHGFNTPNIHEYDTLSSEERWNESFDVVLANPPFMSPKGGIRPHKKFTISSNRSEVLFVDYIAEHLNPKGRAGIIVPEGIIFQSGTAYKDLRKMLVENHLYAVVSLPAGVFNPYSGVKTSILLMDKKIAKKREEILFIKIDNDGYNLGAQRNAIKGGQLEEAIKITHQFVETGELVKTQDLASQLTHLVPKAEIAKNGDFNLSGERYKIALQGNSDFDYVSLEEILKLSSGNGLTSKNMDVGDYPVYGGNGITGWHSQYFVEKPTIVIGRVGAYCGSIHITKPKSWITDNGLYVTEYLKNEVNQSFIALMLEELRLNRFAKVGGQPSLSQSTIKEQKIPLPPLSIQEEIVAEIESYQKIIDGAKAVVENYKPKIDIHPDWEMVELGEVCEINPKKSELKELNENTEVSFVPMADLNENQIYFKPIQVKLLGEVIKGYTYFKDDDVLLAKVTPCFENGKAGIAKELINGIGFGSSEYFVIRPNDKILSTWIYLNIIPQGFRERGKLNMTGTGGLQRVPPDFVKSTLIPLPDLDTQRQIVSQIEKEQELVNANKQLIEIFEQKIKNMISKVWGTPTETDINRYKTPYEQINIAAEPQAVYGKP
ncbi:MAG: N-6 DNA methylase [Saprospiraceae bacterium]|nr:N-6 DNA methylase [Saprospiraceae bacterium]